MKIQLHTIPEGTAGNQYLADTLALAQRCQENNAAEFTYTLSPDYFKRLLGPKCFTVLGLEKSVVRSVSAFQKLTEVPEYLIPFVPESTEPHELGVMLFSLVDPQCRGHGIGCSMFELRFDHAVKQADIKHLFATTHPKNEPAKKLLEKNNFKEITTQPFFDTQVLRTLYYLAMQVDSS